MTVAVIAPTYFECADCGFYHRQHRTHIGACQTDPAERFTPEELDELHGEQQWQEIEGEVELPVQSERARKNLDRLTGLTAETDYEGNVLEPGCSVRVFDFYRYDPETDGIAGINTIGDRVSYAEGVLVRINEPNGKYTVQLRIEVQRTNTTSRIAPGSIVSRPIGGLCYPPTNGTPTQMGWPTFGVFRIE